MGLPLRIRARRWFLALGVCVVLSSAVPVASSGSLPTAAAKAAASPCPSYRVYGLRGSGETHEQDDGYGPTIGATRKAIEKLRPDGSFVAVDYDAISVNWHRRKYFEAEYRASEAEGEQALLDRVRLFVKRCPSTPMVLLGYSQGAHAVGNVFALLPTAVRRNVAAVVLFGDPRFNPDQTDVDVGSYDPKRRGVWASSLFTKSRGSEPGVRTIDPGYVPAMHSYCLKHDPICNYSLRDVAKCHACQHLHYVDSPYIRQAAEWVVARLPGPPSPLALMPQALPTGVVGVPYHQTLGVSGGIPPYSWTATGSALAAGISLAGNEVKGTPAAAGSTTLTVTVSDSGAPRQTLTTSFPVMVLPAGPSGLAVTPSTGPVGVDLIISGSCPPASTSAVVQELEPDGQYHERTTASPSPAGSWTSSPISTGWSEEFVETLNGYNPQLSATHANVRRLRAHCLDPAGAVTGDEGDTLVPLTDQLHLSIARVGDTSTTWSFSVQPEAPCPGATDDVLLWAYASSRSSGTTTAMAHVVPVDDFHGWQWDGTIDKTPGADLLTFSAYCRSLAPDGSLNPGYTYLGQTIDIAKV